MFTVKVSAKGSIVIPKRLRDKYGLKKGTHVQVLDYNGIVVLVPLPDDPVVALHGLLQGGPSLTKDLLAERARERAREESRRE